MQAKVEGGTPPVEQKSMARIVSNVGQSGADSIRIGGMTRDTLGMAEAALTNQQWPSAVASNAQQEIENLKSQYPKGSISYYNSRRAECFENIKRVQDLKTQQDTMIEEYNGHIALCKHREKLIADIDPEDRDAIKAVNKQYPPYSVKAMEQQLVQCREAIQRCDDVVAAEYDSISELDKAIERCKMRNVELQKLGADISGLT